MRRTFTGKAIGSALVASALLLAALRLHATPETAAERAHPSELRDLSGRARPVRWTEPHANEGVIASDAIVAGVPYRVSFDPAARPARVEVTRLGTGSRIWFGWIDGAGFAYAMGSNGARWIGDPTALHPKDQRSISADLDLSRSLLLLAHELEVLARAGYEVELPLALEAMRVWSASHAIPRAHAEDARDLLLAFIRSLYLTGSGPRATSGVAGAIVEIRGT